MARPVSTDPVDLSRAESKHKDICERFRKVRTDNRITQKEFAEILQVSESTIKQVERGASAPTYDVLRLLKRKFGVSYDFMIDGKQ